MHETISLYKTFHQYLNLFPKQERFGIGQKCDNVLLNILELIVIASLSSKINKNTHLNSASLKLNTLKILFRLINELQIIDLKKYIQLQTHCQTIGRMLGGWIKSLKN